MKKNDKLKRVELLLCDVDGVLTDEKIIYNDDGTQIKFFNVKDGLGLSLLMKEKIKVGIVTAKGSNALRHRCDGLGIKLVYENVTNKGEVLNEICEITGVSPENIAFVGDDLPDLRLMKKVGISIAVNNACSDVIEYADFKTTKNGGYGAVREICEAILKSKELWPKIIEKF